MQKIEQIAITGGTHGNELTGVYLINKFKKNPSLIERKNFKTHIMHTNLGAMKQCTRYVDKDINRTFTLAGLSDPTLDSYEDKLAKEINQIIGPKGSENPNMDFILDLHSTTSNMGLSICISSGDKLSWQAVGYIKEKMPEVNIFSWEGDTGEAAFVSSIVKSGFTIEVGAIPQGVVRADMLFGTEKIVQHLLDFLELYKEEKVKTYTSVEIYENSRLIDYPKDENGAINAIIHPSLQDNDYATIKKGTPIFVTLEGEDVLFEEDDIVHGLFINEAAYYEKGVAMALAYKKTIQI